MIRKMEAGDLDAIMDIWLNANLDAHSFIERQYWENNLTTVRNAIAQAEVYCFVDDQGQVQGFIGLQDSYVAGLFIAKAYRGQHIGSALLRLAQEKYDQLSLDVYVKNQAAVAFYQTHGFRVGKSDGDGAKMTWRAQKD